MIQEVQLKTNISIKAPIGELCDTVDSDMMACYPFVMEEREFSSTIVEYDKIFKKLNKNIKNPARHDYEWDKITTEENPYDFIKEETRGRPKEGRRK